MMNLDPIKTREINRKIHNDPIAFSEVILGITLHDGQKEWIRNSTKRINILRPGNRYGKTFVAAIKHIWHAMCKPRLDGKVLTNAEWLRIEYQTLNFGPTYEMGRAALQTARDIVQGNVLLPSGQTNNSLLKDWAIIEDKCDASQLPSMTFITGAKILGRSYSEMGMAFKTKGLAYVAGDECADIDELWTFVNNTLLPRVVSFNGTIDLVGTPQPEGHDYMRMIEMAEEDMKLEEYKTNGMFYTQKGRMYENPYIPKAAIKDIERIADPVMREQIINGEYVEIGDKYFGYERVQNAVDKELQTLEYGLPGRKYITSVDFAGGESAWADYTVITTVDYTEEPYTVINFKRFKGGDIPIPMQYRMVEETVKAFDSKLIIDASALGGKNALAFLGHLNPISQEYGPTKSSTLKADMLATMKICFDGGQSGTRKRERELVNGLWIDKVEPWGLIRIPNIMPLVLELQNYKVDDAKIRTDTVMSLSMAIYYIERRRPKQIRRKAVDMDFLSI
jgi:hypothetical protein